MIELIMQLMNIFYQPTFKTREPMRRKRGMGVTRKKGGK